MPRPPPNSPLFPNPPLSRSGFWDQYNNRATEPPLGIGSQKFESAMSAFDNQAADDFVIGGGWGAPYITGVRVMGEYSAGDRKSTRLNSSHLVISYAVFCLKK